MTRHILLPVLAALAVSACAATPPSEAPITSLPGFEPGADSCGAGARAYLIGQPIGEVDQPSLARTVRAIHPGQPVTQDYSPFRLNLDLDGDGVIVRVWCG
jgi:hypothetical protein